MSNAVRDFALEVATKAAKNINGSVREVLLRTKSQAYLFGQLRRRFPDAAEDEIRATLTQLKHDPELEDEVFISEPRAPVRGREAANDVCWPSRVERLLELVPEPVGADALVHRAQAHFGWHRNFTIQTLAAAETAGLLEWTEGAWRRPEPEQADQPEPEPVVVLNATAAQPEDPMLTTTQASNAPPAAPQAQPSESREERKRRQKRESERRYRAKKRNGAPAPAPPQAPVTPVAEPAAASGLTLDSLIEERVRQMVRTELRAEFAKALGDLVGKVLAA